MKRTIAALVSVALLGCSISIDGSRYQSLKPKFAPEVFFNGKVKAWGIVQNRSGNMVQQFVVDIDGTFDGQVLTLDETFHYSVGDGVSERQWVINVAKGDGQYSGTAGDIEGVAQGQTFGPAMNWRYSMVLPVDDSEYTVTFDDWMWAFDQKRLMNRSYIKKFGIVMAEVTIFMQREETGHDEGNEI